MSQKAEMQNTAIVFALFAANRYFVCGLALEGVLKGNTVPIDRLWGSGREKGVDRRTGEVSRRLGDTVNYMRDLGSYW